MTALLIIAHEPLASALGQVARHVYPDCEADLQILDVPAGMTPEAVEDRARALLRQSRHDDVLVLTDVFGATPCNVAERLADVRHVRVLAGVNVPMLWRALCYRNEPLDRVAERALSGATQGAMPLTARAPQNQAIRALNHDQDHRHDQQ